MTIRSPITTHVLDTSCGRPAAGVVVTLARETDGDWTLIAVASTDADGRVTNLLDPSDRQAGVYRLRFATEAYFAKLGVDNFYPYADVVFKVGAADQHVHVPLLLNPFGYSTYRGS